MEVPSEILEQTAYSTRPKTEEHMLIVMHKSTHEEHLTHPLQSNKTHFKIFVTFLTVHNGIIKGTSKNKKFCFSRSNNTDNFTQISVSPGAYEVESLNNEIKSFLLK